MTTDHLNPIARRWNEVTSEPVTDSFQLEAVRDALADCAATFDANDVATPVLLITLLELSAECLVAMFGADAASVLRRLQAGLQREIDERLAGRIPWNLVGPGSGPDAPPTTPQKPNPTRH